MDGPDRSNLVFTPAADDITMGFDKEEAPRTVDPPDSDAV